MRGTVYSPTKDGDTANHTNHGSGPAKADNGPLPRILALQLSPATGQWLEEVCSTTVGNIAPSHVVAELNFGGVGIGTARSATTPRSHLANAICLHQ